ncbi:MAG TPA: hypothetical protein VFV83_09805 [Chthoniobacteraceae bacterium]|nr:hypothetical protein [Chthoniobacteraceae bacterium]
MSKRPSALGVLAPIVLILIAGFVYYAKYHWARAWVDERFPWVKENVGIRLPSLVVTVGPDGQPLDANEGTPSEVPPGARFTSSDGAVDLPTLAADPASWPKTVKLRKAREFPGVVDGKTVGKIVAPAGAETRLVAIQSGKLGLEFRGGGAWVSPDETDLSEQLRKAQR